MPQLLLQLRHQHVDDLIVVEAQVVVVVLEVVVGLAALQQIKMAQVHVAGMVMMRLTMRLQTGWLALQQHPQTMTCWLWFFLVWCELAAAGAARLRCTAMTKAVSSCQQQLYERHHDAPQRYHRPHLAV